MCGSPRSTTRETETTEMITYHRTSILSSQAQTVVNTVNTVGVMGKGLASEFKSRFPEMFKLYQEFCKSGQLTTGKLWLWKGENQWVLNFPTKEHWKRPSRLEYIESGLKKFVEEYEKRGMTEVAFPRLGCGNGGLDWQDVRPIMEKYLSDLPIQIFIHDFEKDIGLPEHREKSSEQNYYFERAASQNRSFDAFKNSINDTISRRGGCFNILTRESKFKAETDSVGNIIIKSSKKEKRIEAEDLFEVWSMLLKGPVTRRQLSGSAWDSAFLLLSILAHVPSIRPIHVATRQGEESVAIELLKYMTPDPVIVE